MGASSNKLIAICLAWLILLAPVGNVVAALAVPSASAHASHSMQMLKEQGGCADCHEHNGTGKSCCDGTSCALMGGCSGCAAVFPLLRLPIAVDSASRRLSLPPSILVSVDPDRYLRPPRA